MINNFHTVRDRQILKITQDEYLNLKFSWNFNGLMLGTTTRKHLFLCLSEAENERQFLKEFAKKYYENLRSGDLYSVRMMGDKCKSWQEKTQINQFSTKNSRIKKIQNERNQEFKERAMKFLEKNLIKQGSCNLPILVIINLDEGLDLVEVQKHLSDWRIEHGITAFFMILSQKYTENRLSFEKGIILLNTKLYGLELLPKLTHKILRSQCYQTVDLVLSSQNRDIFCHEKYWSQTNFQTIQKRFYYPINQDYEDTLPLLFGLCSQNNHIAQTRNEPEELGIWKFKLSLTYQLLDGSRIFSEKDVELNVSDTRHHFSYCHPGMKGLYKYQFYDWGLSLADNPFIRVETIKMGSSII